ncbi:MAG TPA: hypothetical protein VEK34_14980 [Methylocella sp.]|nr:hypothetical protein [Methylocella sp.]
MFARFKLLSNMAIALTTGTALFAFASQSTSAGQNPLVPRVIKPRTGSIPTGPFGLGPISQPPRDFAADTATPAPFFPTPIQLTPPPNANATSSFSFPSAVSCTSPGNCVAVGFYLDSKQSFQGMIITETDGVWGQGVEVALPANAAAGTSPFGQFANFNLNSLTCTSPGNCVAVGNYTDNNGNSPLFILTETNGVWAQGAELNLLLPANAAANTVTLVGLTCTSAGNCVAVGVYDDAKGNNHPLAVNEINGVWAPGVEIAPPANADPNPHGAMPCGTCQFIGGVELDSVSCFRSGNCVAGGFYTDTTPNSDPMIATETDGVWSRAIELTLPSNASIAQGIQEAFIGALTCFSPGSCTAGGGYSDITGSSQPLVVNQTHGVWAQGFELTLPANAATAPGTQSAYLNGLTCTSRGNCIAYSAYNDIYGAGQPLVITETGGVWAQGIEPPLPANATTTPGAQNSNIYGASCTSPGVCVAVGNYTDMAGNLQLMAYTTVPTLSIKTAGLPSATAGSNYWARLFAAGGVGPNKWSVSAGSLPAGLTLNVSTGRSPARQPRAGHPVSPSR